MLRKRRNRATEGEPSPEAGRAHAVVKATHWPLQQMLLLKESHQSTEYYSTSFMDTAFLDTLSGEQKRRSSLPLL